MDSSPNPTPDIPAEISHSLLTLENGDNVLVSEHPLMSMEITILNNPVIDSQQVSLTPVEALDVMKKAETNFVSLDTINGNISVIPKETSMPTDSQTDTSNTESTT